MDHHSGSCVSEHEVLQNYIPSKRRISELWFDDGTVIIQCEGTVFRVAGGVLAARSPKLKGIFSTPRLVGHSDVGCPVVYLDDDAEDMTYFLLAVFDSGFFEPVPAQTQLCIVVGVLRLSTKYNVTYLRNRALDHILLAYPMALDDWERRWELRTFAAPEDPLERFSVIKLALESDVRWIIPLALYDCCAYDTDTAIAALSALTQNQPSTKDDILSCLCYGGLDRIRSLDRDFLNAINAMPSNCSTSSACCLALVHYFNEKVQLDGGVHLLDVMSRVEWVQVSERVCDECIAQARRIMDDWRITTWVELPRIAKEYAYHEERRDLELHRVEQNR